MLNIKSVRLQIVKITQETTLISNFSIFVNMITDYNEWAKACPSLNLSELKEVNIISHYFICGYHFPKTHFTRYLTPQRTKLKKNDFPIMGKC